MWYMWLIIILILAGQGYIFVAKLLPGRKKFNGIFSSDAKVDNRWYLKNTETISRIKKHSEPKYEYTKNPLTNEYEGNIVGYEEVEEEVQEEVQVGSSQIGAHGPSRTMKNILAAINRYLKENASRTSDFALLKDIVDRNVDAEEEDVRELVPLPLYLGLAGTMLGIALGVGSLAYGGGLDAMFDPEQSSVSAKGIAPLLKDVSLAMICSFFGLGFTTAATLLMRMSKTKVEREKHEFLSWMQAKLLPQMPDNMSSVVLKLTGNLTDFNRTFGRNADQLNVTLKRINEASEENRQLLEAVKSLNNVRLSEVNLALYERLSKATQEIGTLARYLENCSSYLNQVKALNDKLDNGEERTKAIEAMGEYFMKEKAHIVHVSNLTQETIGKTEEDIRKSVNQFGENVETYFIAMQENLQKQASGMERVLAEQQQALTKKTSEMSQVVSELRSMGEVKKAMNNLSDAYREQNRLLSVAVSQRGQNATPLPIQQPQAKLPKWISILAIVVAVFIIMAVLLFVAKTFHLFNLQ